MRVLIVNHECSRSGAPKVAGVVAEALRQQGDHVMMVHRHGGPLQAELSATAHEAFMEPLRRARAFLRRHRATKALAMVIERVAVRYALRRTQPDLVWANTAASAAYLRPAARRGGRVVLHLHEIGTFVAQIDRRYDLRSIIDRFEVVACSTAVADSATTVWADATMTVLHTPLIDTQPPNVERPADSNTAIARVVGCGQQPLAKGLDRFCEVAALFSSTDPTVEFHWLGTVEPHVIERLDPHRVVTFAGSVPDAAARIATADVFLSTGRADPFPIVVLEAMAGGTPVVAFDSGGAAEQLGDTGLLVTDGDTVAMAAAIRALLDAPDRRRELALSARERLDAWWSRRRFAELVVEYVHPH